MFVLLLGSVLASAHEFWLEPDKFFYTPGDEAAIRLNVGENFAGEQWDLARHKVVKLDWLTASKKTDVRDKLVVADEEPLKLKLEDEGNHMIVLQSNEAFIELEGDKFNEYLKEDGLDAIYNRRKQTNTLDKPGREFYSRYAKLLVQVGDKHDDTYGKVLGLPLEIIPDRNPYGLKEGDQIKFKVLFRGKPLFGAKVMVWNRNNNKVWMQPNYSMKDGTIDIRMGNSGTWMVSVVHMIPTSKPGADYESFWGSFVFGTP